MENSKVINAIQEKMRLIDGLSDYIEFNVWKKSATITLLNIYSENDKRVKAFEEIQAYINMGIATVDRLDKAKAEATEILKGIIGDIEVFGIQKSNNQSKSGGVQVHVNQNNSQIQETHVRINVDFIIQELRLELRASEVDALKEILESEDEPKEKKKRFIEKIKSFGSDVASNILANILTNPKVYEQIGTLL